MREFMKYCGIKLGSGFLLGVGFSTALYLVSYIVFENYDVFNDTDDYEIDSVTGENQSGLIIVEHSDKSNEEEIIILGKLKNNGDKTWRSLNVEAEFFYEGNFVEECNTYIRRTFNPLEEENFKISCGGCKGYILPKYDEYTVRVKHAYEK